MKPDPAVCLEALGALTGCRVEASGSASQLSPQDLVNIVALRQFYKQEGFKELEYPSLGTLSLQDPEDQDQDLYGPPPALAEGPSTTGAPGGATTTLKIRADEFFHHQYDYDFSNIQDGDRKFLRGDEQYVRPCGWTRVALRVTGQYDDGDDLWLGTGSRSWPVSYNGHNMDGSLGVILAHGGDPQDAPAFLDTAAASLVATETRGRGIYSTPDIKMAEKYCRRFRSKVDGKTYKVVLQNRINPKKRVRCQRDGVWLVYVPEDCNPVQTRALVQESIRPYGLLLRQA